jgi:hypothetical protein
MGKDGGVKYFVLFLIAEGAGIACLMLRYFDHAILAGLSNGAGYLVFAFVLERYWSERK